MLEIDLTVLNDSSYSYFILLYFYENLKKISEIHDFTDLY
ncbi:hypothetical protein SPAR96_1297 [Streptococcus pneumoniae GA47388]|nr:hypothetical protein SPAR86_1220 [Streptococcus pneumoniae GA44511]EHE37631.1 hypothetical protein SPAR96_1297 [Streptococcus pneumoniae GA47388]EHE51554.1 hypothetical protein SPAR118_1199 [Streptococcus pneumoniae GA54644]EHZ48307.1 hypothetical protein SPAR75_0648 [Streptococcus pneumoniae GA43257]EJH09583.1 hypothetical protein SPAR61_1408 [Streptococcus pneumoniae GA19998]